MAAEVTLKEESALEIGKQLAFSFQGLQKVGADTANGGLELEEEKQQTSFLESISGGIKKMVVFFGGLAASVKEARRERLITEALGTEQEKEALKNDPERSFGIKDMFKAVGEKTKKFTGGNLCFPMWDIEIECKHNRVFCFPSSIPHKATKISMEKNDLGKKLGRFVMGQFFVFCNKF